MADLDFTDVEAFARDLEDAGAATVLAARKIVKKGAQKVKDRLQHEAAGERYAPSLPQDITYDVDLTRDEVVAEIGPLTKKAGGKGGGSLAFFYLGNSKTGPRLPDPMIAADDEAEVMARQLIEAGVESLG